MSCTFTGHESFASRQEPPQSYALWRIILCLVLDYYRKLIMDGALPIQTDLSQETILHFFHPCHELQT
jgi:hypothetical protein